MSLDPVRDLIAFIASSPTPYHAVSSVTARLSAHGFSPLDECEAWSLVAGGKHYVVRDDSSIIAFVVGDDSPETAGFAMVGARTRPIPS
jgi:aspartyl aminopeptidase